MNNRYDYIPPELKEPNVTKEMASDKQIGGGHYKDMPIQPYEFCYRNKLDYLQSNVIKYTLRHKFKNGKEDLEKAIHTLQVMIEYEYPEVKEEPSKPDRVIRDACGRVWGYDTGDSDRVEELVKMIDKERGKT